MENKILQSDLKCIPMQKMVFEKTMNGASPNSFEPRKTPGEHTREDGVRYVNDICYGTNYPNSYLDIYYSTEGNTESAPTVIYIHGGGMIFGDKVAGDPLAAGSGRDVDFCADVARRGYNVVSPNYALAPQYRFPVAIKQVDEILVFLEAHQKELKLNMACVFLGGGSAGADFTEIYAAALMNKEYAELIGIHPVFNPGVIAGLIIDEAALSTRNFESNMNAILGCWMGLDEPSGNSEADRMLDPTRWITNGYFPSFIISSNMEIWFKDSADDLAAALDRVGVAYDYYYRGQEFDQLEHGYMKRYNENKWAKECFEHVLRFLNTHSTVPGRRSIE